MNSTFLACSIALLLGAGMAMTADAAPDNRLYEMRVYYAAEGKLDALHARFRDHTTGLFKKHGMENIGYWVPIENPERKLIYLLAYPDKAGRDRSWKAFGSDPDWKSAQKSSEVNGKLVAKVEVTYLKATDYSPAIAPKKADEPRTFELRTYTATEGNLDKLNSRFRDHTVKLFSRHGMSHFGYWTPAPGQPNATNTLIYILAHKSTQAAGDSFNSFRADPDWVKAKIESEKGGSLTTPGGVKSVMMKPTDYSPAR